MAWASRIESETQRHVVIAVIMGVLLAASVAAAAYVTAQRRAALQEVRADAALEPDRVADFTLRRPGGWTTTDLAEESTDPFRPLIAWQEPSGAQRNLTLFELTHAQPVAPETAIELFAAREAEYPGQFGRSGATQSKNMVGIVAEHLRPDTQGRIISRLIAAMTADGRRHALLVLQRPGELRPADWRLMVQMSASLADADYETLEAGSVALGENIELPVPEGLTALVRQGQPDEQGDQPGPPLPRILITPEQPRFFLIEPMAMRYEIDSEQDPSHELLESSGEGTQEQQDSDVDPDTLGPDERPIVAALVVRYAQLTGERPPQRSVRQLDTPTRRGFSLGLPANGSGANTGLWAIDLADQHVLVLQITAEADTVAAARDAAQRLVSAVEPETPNDDEAESR